jgi:hypothetical protein
VELLVTIGLDPDLVERLRGALEARVVAYPAVPRLYSVEGRVRVDSASVSGRWLEPRGIVYYGYFEHAGVARRALALGATPTFPDVGATLPLDERAMALLLASRADEPGPPRGYVPAGLELALEREQVLKWGNRHCGEDKARASGSVQVTNAAIIEPFIEGRSERVLLVGEHAWHLRYESSDWRKNVRATVAEIEPDADLVARARQTAGRLGLAIAGVDYVVGESDATLLEVNAYPGLDDVPAAAEAFVELARGWWERLHRPAVSGGPSEMSALHDELNAADGSFLLQLRVELRWDATAFRRLTREMLTYVGSRDPEADLPRWAAEGFWFASWFVKSWSQHPNFSRPFPAEYYEAAYGRLHDLAFWLFTGRCSYQDASELERPLPAEPST